MFFVFPNSFFFFFFSLDPGIPLSSPGRQLQSGHVSRFLISDCVCFWGFQRMGEGGCLCSRYSLPDWPTLFKLLHPPPASLPSTSILPSGRYPCPKDSDHKQVHPVSFWPNSGTAKVHWKVTLRQSPRDPLVRQKSRVACYPWVFCQNLATNTFGFWPRVDQAANRCSRMLSK